MKWLHAWRQRRACGKGRHDFRLVFICDLTGMRVGCDVDDIVTLPGFRYEKAVCGACGHAVQADQSTYIESDESGHQWLHKAGGAVLLISEAGAA